MEDGRNGEGVARTASGSNRDKYRACSLTAPVRVGSCAAYPRLFSSSCVLPASLLKRISLSSSDEPASLRRLAASPLIFYIWTRSSISTYGNLWPQCSQNVQSPIIQKQGPHSMMNPLGARPIPFAVAAVTLPPLNSHYSNPSPPQSSPRLLSFLSRDGATSASRINYGFGYMNLHYCLHTIAHERVPRVS